MNADTWTVILWVAVNVIGCIIWRVKGCPDAWSHYPSPEDCEPGDLLIGLLVVALIIGGLFVLSIIPAPVWQFLDGWVMQ